MQIKTNFVKEKIKRLHWDNIIDRKYIEDLMFIEDMLSINARGWGYAGAMKLSFMKTTYAKEYEEIYKELDPDGFGKAEAREEKNASERESVIDKLRRIEEEKNKEFKREWLRVGGRK